MPQRFIVLKLHGGYRYLIRQAGTHIYQLEPAYQMASDIPSPVHLFVIRQKSCMTSTLPRLAVSPRRQRLRRRISTHKRYLYPGNFRIVGNRKPEKSLPSGASTLSSSERSRGLDVI